MQQVGSQSQPFNFCSQAKFHLPKNLPTSFPFPPGLLILSFSISLSLTHTYHFLLQYIKIFLSASMVEAASLMPHFYSLALLYMLVAIAVHCHGDKKLLDLQNLHWQQQSGIPSCLFRKSRSEKGAVVMEMRPRDLCTEKIVDWNSKLQKLLAWDYLHVRSVQNRIRIATAGKIQDMSETQVPLLSGLKLRTLNYIVTMELGGQNMTVIVDTGSDLTWVQCQPCKSCYDQQGPLFQPSTSPSYQSVICNSSTCQSLQSATGNSGICGSTLSSACNYVVNYGDGSYTSGDLATENLTLGSTHLNAFVFGCGRNNKGLFGGASGLMGLGRSDLSMVYQTSSVFGGVFSYCLPSTQSGASGSLVMGFDTSAYKNVTPISYTAMLPSPQLSTFYVLNLTGVSVGGVALEASSFGKGGILIDSGTVISRLAPSAYKVVKEEFLKQFSGFPSAPGFSILETCFNLTGYEQVNIPTISMYFEGNAELSVDAAGIFYFVKTDASQVCLALASLADEQEIGIIGNYQQRNQRVIYDTKHSTVGFAEEPCTYT